MHIDNLCNRNFTHLSAIATSPKSTLCAEMGLDFYFTCDIEHVPTLALRSLTQKCTAVSPRSIRAAFYDLELSLIDVAESALVLTANSKLPGLHFRYNLS